MPLRTIVRRTTDHRGQNRTIRYLLELECGHTVVRLTANPSRHSNRIHCPHCQKETAT